MSSIIFLINIIKLLLWYVIIKKRNKTSEKKAENQSWKWKKNKYKLKKLHKGLKRKNIIL